MITLIVARARNGAIGKNGTIPWRAPEDLAFFQRETMGGAVIMGRRTWDSLPFRPLKNRLNIVVSSRSPDAPIVCRNIDSALSHAGRAGHARIYGIGGAHIYAEMLPRTDRLLITEVDMDVPEADTFFPAFDASDWQLTRQITLRDSDPHCVMHEFIRLRMDTSRSA